VEAATFFGAIETKLNAGDAAAGDSFGISVAISGDTAVVGAKGNDDAGDNSGSAYVFVRSGGSWSQQAKLTADDAAIGDLFGYSVAISSDTVVVGAYQDDDAGTSSGSAYVFVRSGGSWSQQAKLTADDAAADDLFGISVAISDDTTVIGAQYDDNSGSAYVFVRSGGSWSQQAKLIASDAAAGDWFGGSVAINGDTVVVGAHGDDTWDNQSGSAYVFFRSGGSWSQQAKLTGGELSAAYDWFGGSVAINGDTAVVGAEGNDDAGSNSGSAYVFVRRSDGWSQQAKLTAGDAAAGDSFGISVAISGDTAVVGAYKHNIWTGSVYVFDRSGGSWSQQAKLTTGDAAAGAAFGYSVAISGDTAVVGAERNNYWTGSTYVYQAVPTEFELLQAHLESIEDQLWTHDFNMDARMGALENGVDEIASVVRKIDMELSVQTPNKDLVIYHIGTSFGGLPVQTTLIGAQGFGWKKDTGVLIIDLDLEADEVRSGSWAPGHLWVFVNIVDADDYHTYQFVAEYDFNGTLIRGTIMLENLNYKNWQQQ
jgi:hypothetical protein